MIMPCESVALWSFELCFDRINATVRWTVILHIYREHVILMSVP